jgi:hypothetical protein
MGLPDPGRASARCSSGGMRRHCGATFFTQPGRRHEWASQGWHQRTHSKPAAVKKRSLAHQAR